MATRWELAEKACGSNSESNSSGQRLVHAHGDTAPLGHAIQPGAGSRPRSGV